MLKNTSSTDYTKVLNYWQTYKSKGIEQLEDTDDSSRIFDSSVLDDSEGLDTVLFNKSSGVYEEDDNRRLLNVIKSATSDIKDSLKHTYRTSGPIETSESSADSTSSSKAGSSDKYSKYPGLACIQFATDHYSIDTDSSPSSSAGSSSNSGSGASSSSSSKSSSVVANSSSDSTVGASSVVVSPSSSTEKTSAASSNSSSSDSAGSSSSGSAASGSKFFLSGNTSVTGNSKAVVSVATLDDSSGSSSDSISAETAASTLVTTLKNSLLQASSGTISDDSSILSMQQSLNSLIQYINSGSASDITFPSSEVNQLSNLITNIIAYESASSSSSSGASTATPAANSSDSTSISGLLAQWNDFSKNTTLGQAISTGSTVFTALTASVPFVSILAVLIQGTSDYFSGNNGSWVSCVLNAALDTGISMITAPFRLLESLWNAIFGDDKKADDGSDDDTDTQRTDDSSGSVDAGYGENNIDLNPTGNITGNTPLTGTAIVTELGSGDYYNTDTGNVDTSDTSVDANSDEDDDGNYDDYYGYDSSDDGNYDDYSVDEDVDDYSNQDYSDYYGGYADSSSLAGHNWGLFGFIDDDGGACRDGYGWTGLC